MEEAIKSNEGVLLLPVVLMWNFNKPWISFVFSFLLNHYYLARSLESAERTGIIIEIGYYNLIHYQ